MSQAQILIERFNKADDKAQFIEDERKLQPLITEQYSTYEYWLLVDLTVVMFMYSRKVMNAATDAQCSTTYNEQIEECHDNIKRDTLIRELAYRYNVVLTEVQREEQSEHDRTEFFERICKITDGEY